MRLWSPGSTLINSKLNALFIVVLLIIPQFRLGRSLPLSPLRPNSRSPSANPSIYSIAYSRIPRITKTISRTSIATQTHSSTHTHIEATFTVRSKNSTDSALLDECMSRPLSPALWKEMDMDHFLKNYPEGNNLTLSLADRVKLTNFDCGIEKICFADQLCHPVRGKEWYILVAAQEWNSFMNAAYQAIGWAITMIQGIAPSMVADFYPDLPDTWAIIKGWATLLTAVSKVFPTEGLLTAPKWLYQLVQGEFGLSAGIANLMDDVIIKNPINQHDKWTTLSYTLSKNQELAQMTIANISQSTIDSGISTDKGIYQFLKGGEFLVDHSTPRCRAQKRYDNFAGEKQAEMKTAIQLHLLAAMWEQQDPCTGPGANGAWQGEDVLSYCGPDNVLVNFLEEISRFRALCALWFKLPATARK